MRRIWLAAKYSKIRFAESMHRWPPRSATCATVLLDLRFLPSIPSTARACTPSTALSVFHSSRSSRRLGGRVHLARLYLEDATSRTEPLFYSRVWHRLKKSLSLDRKLVGRFLLRLSRGETSSVRCAFRCMYMLQLHPVCLSPYSRDDRK